MFLTFVLLRQSLIVIDFGLAIIAEPNTVLESRVGTYYYMSPELLGRRYNRPTDMWSCGVIAFVLLAGYPPFFGDRESLVLKRVSLNAAISTLVGFLTDCCFVAVPDFKWPFHLRRPGVVGR